MFFPWMIIVLGVIFLLQNLNILPEGFWGYFWPVILIIVGLSMLNKRTGGACCGAWCKKESKEEVINHKEN